MPHSNALKQFPKLWPAETAVPKTLLDMNPVSTPYVVEELDACYLIGNGMSEGRIKTLVHGVLTVLNVESLQLGDVS